LTTGQRFDADTLRALDEALEVDIETLRPDGSARRTIIWVMVEDGDVFARSWKGDRGYWFQSALEPDAKVALIVEGGRLPVTVHLATDPESIRRTDDGLKRKYPGNESLDGMLRAEILGTTVRIEPTGQSEPTDQK
jgi:hypothetical protein